MEVCAALLALRLNAARTTATTHSVTAATVSPAALSLLQVHRTHVHQEVASADALVEVQTAVHSVADTAEVAALVEAHSAEATDNRDELLVK